MVVNGSNVTDLIICYEGHTGLSIGLDTKYFYLAICICVCVLVSATIVLNGLFLIAMAVDRRHLTISRKLLVLLSCINMVQGVIILPIYAYNMGELFLQTLTCALYNNNSSFGFALGFMTLTTIIIIGVDQYIAIIHPFYYHNQLTTRKLILPLIAMWIVLYVFNALGNFYMISLWLIYKGLIVVISAVSLIVLFFLYFRIWQKAKGVTRKISIANASEGREIQKRAKATKNSVIILVTYMTCYLPLIVYIFYDLLGKRSEFAETYLETSANTVALSSTSWTAIVYYWRMEFVRKITKMVLLRCFCKDHAKFIAQRNIALSSLTNISASVVTRDRATTVTSVF